MTEALFLRVRPLAAIWLVVILVLLVSGRYQYTRLSAGILSDAQSRAVGQLKCVVMMLAERDPFSDSDQLAEWVARVGRRLGARITYMSEGGAIIGDSDLPISEILEAETFSTRPEILQARDREIGISIRYSKTVKRDEIFVASRIAGKGPIPGGVIRLAVPCAGSENDLLQLRNTLLIHFGLVLLAFLPLSLLLMQWLSRSVHTVADAIHAVPENLRHRLRFAPNHVFYPLAQSFNRMADRIDERLQTIRAQCQELEAVFNGIQQGIMLLDSNGRIQSINSALSGIVQNPSQALGRRPLEVFMNLELQEACDHVLADLSIGDSAVHSLQISMDNGRAYDVAIMKMKDHRKGMGAVVAFHETTELRRLERARQDFVANISHEMRTPIGVVKEIAETILDPAPKDLESLRPSLEVLHGNVQHMHKLVEDLLLLAALEAPDAVFQPIRVDAFEAWTEALQACIPPAQERGIALKCSFIEHEVYVVADFDQLALVFRNLLENAIRYSPHGGAISVSYRLQRDFIRFAIRDRGPGIAGQHQQRIFERFYRVERDDRTSQGGSTGLGLAICKHIIRNHGGAIWVQSPNHDDLTGTTVYFTLPQSLHGRG